jgi:hypothetical protein
MESAVSMHFAILVSRYHFSPSEKNVLKEVNLLDLSPGTTSKHFKRVNVGGRLIRPTGSFPTYKGHAFIVIVSNYGGLLNVHVSHITTSLPNCN